MFKERKARKIVASAAVAMSLLGASTITASSAAAQSASLETFEEFSEIHNGCGRVGIKGLDGIDNVSVGLVDAAGGVHTGDPVEDGAGVTTLGVRGIVGTVVVEGIHAPAYFKPGALNIVTQLDLPALETSCLVANNSGRTVWEDLNGDYRCSRIGVLVERGNSGKGKGGLQLDGTNVSIGLIDASGGVHVGDPVHNGFGVVTMGMSGLEAAVVIDGKHAPGYFPEGSLKILAEEKLPKKFERSCLVSSDNGADVFEDATGDYDCTRIGIRAGAGQSVGLLDAHGGVHIGDAVVGDVGVITVGVTDIVAAVTVDGTHSPGYFAEGDLNVLTKSELPTPFNRSCV